jgi:uncharacterized protein YndB with AHSA1/START domain
VSTITRFMPVSPEDVWEVLADPGEYGYWVVGSKVIRDADDNWPEPGAKFHHTVGFGPIKLSDHTVSLEADPPLRLKLRAKGRPLGTASVTMEMIARDGGTEVRMTENPDGIYRPLGFMAPLQIGSLGRNAESLMRLEELALRKARRR